ncbi:MAG: DUF1015 domain-containing protein [Candidatus Aenigmarchaeota archaeon]|nr:DUF1015 domain-containing protein [Candidatus Aenigmarchaeota archaeon]
MVEVQPFRGIFYDKARVDLKDVVAPPYDVISDPTKYTHEYNIARIDLGKDAELFINLLGGGVLKSDEKPAIYAYEQEYLFSNEWKRRMGFIALAKLEDYTNRMILPHENTLPHQVEDRLQSLRICRAHFNPIFSLYSDFIPLEIKSDPIIDVEYEEVKHRVWSLDDESLIEKMKKELQDKRVFIADGHHRYEAALRFKNEHPEANYVLMYFTPMYDENLTILPVHRVLKTKITPQDITHLFDVSKVGYNELVEQMKYEGFVMYTKGKYYLLNQKNKLKQPDVIQLHLLFEQLGIEDISYVIDHEEAIKLAENSTAFLLNPIKPEEIETVALADKKLPGKATYFYPKLLSGLVMHKFE